MARRVRKVVSECIFLSEYREEILSPRRRVKKITQAVIARKMGCKQGYVSAIEKGKVKLLDHDPKVQEWVEAYDIPAAHFLRMTINARTYYAMDIERRETWLREKRKFSKVMPLFEMTVDAVDAVEVVRIDFSAYLTGEQQGEEEA